MSHRTVTLGSIAKITSGGTPERTKPEYWNGTIPWVKTAQIQNGTITADDIDEWITPIGLEQSSARMIPKGTILMAMYGQGKTRGQVAILGLDAAINQACAAIQLGEGVNRDYVFQQLQYRYDAIRAMSNTGSQENLNAELIREIAFPLPPVEIQREIAQALDAWDAAIQKTEQLIAAKETWVSAMAKQLYARKAHWQTCRLGSLLREVKVLHGEGSYVIGSVGKDGIKPRSEVYSKALSDNHERNILVRPGWLCFGLASDAMAFGVNITSQTYSVSPAYKTFQVVEADPRFVDGYLRVFNSRLSKRYLITSARQGKAIDFDGLLNDVEFHIPPLDEQRRIAETHTIMQTEIDTFRAYLDALKRQKRGLMQKLLTGQWRLPVPEQESA